MRPTLALLLHALPLLGYTTRRTVMVKNATRKPVSIQLHAHHPDDPDCSGPLGGGPPGNICKVWYDADMENTLITSAGGKEVVRHALKSRAQPPIVHR